MTTKKGRGQSDVQSLSGGMRGPILAPGTLIGGKFRIENRIARGGQASVYLARQEPLNRPVALKLLSPPSYETTAEEREEFEQRFLLEARTLANLDHPNIVTLFDYGETDDGRYYLAMEYISGRRFLDLFKNGPIESRRALGLVLQVSQALRYTHKRGVVHRDVKSSNVLVRTLDNGEEQAKVVDFGLVKLSRIDAGLTQTGMILGSPHFMAPEQATGQAVDHRADIYATGVLLYCGLTGKYPFDGPHATSIITAHVNQDVPSFTATAPTARVPEGLEAIVRRCLEKKPGRRYPSMDALIAELMPYHSGPAAEGVNGEFNTLTRGQPKKPAEMKLILGSCQVDLATRVVSDGDQERERLTSTEVALLAYLVEHSPNTVSREELYREVWEHQADLLTRTLDLAIFRLRKKIEKDPKNPDHVLTVYGRGYSFVPKGEDPQPFPAPVASTVRATNLGREENHFFGRKDEQRALTELIKTRNGFITVLGPPGTGKTRLTKHWAAQHLASGAVTSAWFCDLTETKTKEGVIQAVASDLGVTLTTKTEGNDALARLVGDAIKALESTVVVIDNAEQVVQWVGPLVAGWWQRAPQACMVVTSQVPTGVSMEQRLPLSPLPLPSAVDSAGSCPAIALFVDRARSVKPTFEQTPDNQADIVSIVSALDGLPLAIELAAARMHLMTPAMLHARIADRFRLLKRPLQAGPARHQTLQAALGWSWDLLEPWEQAALAQCSLFHGGFDWEAVEAVVDLSDWPEAPWSVDVVAELIERSLMMVTETERSLGRLSLLSSVAEFARAQRVGMKEACVQGAGLRHAQHFSQFGNQDHIDSLSSTGSVSRLWRIHGELENLVAGVDVALAFDDADTAAQCAIGAAVVLAKHGPFTKATTILDSLLGHDVSPTTQGRLFQYSGWVLKLSGHTSEAEAAYKKALAISHQSGDTLLESNTLALIGTLAREHGHSAQAEQYLDDALKIAEANGHTRSYDNALAYMAVLKAEQGKFTEALAHYQQAIDLARAHGNRAAEGTSIGNMANLHKEQGDFSVALKHYQDALEIAREVGNRRGEGSVLSNTATMHQAMGENAQAFELYSQALVVIGQTGEIRAEGVTLGNMGNLLYSEGNLGSACDYLRRAISICDKVIPGVAGQFRANLAIIRSEQGDFVEARSLLEGARLQAPSAAQATKGTIHCASAQVEFLAGDMAAAIASVSNAESIFEQLQAKPDSELGKAISKARAVIES